MSVTNLSSVFTQQISEFEGNSKGLSPIDSFNLILKKTAEERRHRPGNCAASPAVRPRPALSGSCSLWLLAPISGCVRNFLEPSGLRGGDWLVGTLQQTNCPTQVSLPHPSPPVLPPPENIKLSHGSTFSFQKILASLAIVAGLPLPSSVNNRPVCDNGKGRRSWKKLEGLQKWKCGCCGGGGRAGWVVGR